MVTGIVLAGGQSSRMGCDKAFLPMGTRQLIDVVIDRLRRVAQRVIVVGHAGNVERLAAARADAVVTDLAPGLGPLMGIYTGLMHTTTVVNVVAPCDMPCLDLRLLKQLLSRCAPEREVVASRHSAEGVQPFPLICHVAACRSIGALLDRGERSLQAVLNLPQAHVAAIDDPELGGAFRNVNTAEDYARLTSASRPARWSAP
jgi:molybdopterin-guanine dinucleotide biosynthesis protein A